MRAPTCIAACMMRLPSGYSTSFEAIDLRGCIAGSVVFEDYSHTFQRPHEAFSEIAPTLLGGMLYMAKPNDPGTITSLSGRLESAMQDFSTLFQRMAIRP
ncbi:uncharacterized protein BDZ99DRAFT_208531 [Mytilinidion resinicola]|uniref:Uncharacterized protein n=1 Tax=Mytilinidion resinicola TaxID=574789 RepID=A0A6A6XZR0_9PEZI|nr:uncharacterized protein BDZ99DRAFT_208531 [Mytilinidion resinicola]KAF2802056.1 hypothetical protein BDZ99DRAFT_208531 [Mytilinidion resinicola]